MEFEKQDWSQSLKIKVNIYYHYLLEHNCNEQPLDSTLFSDLINSAIKEGTKKSNVLFLCESHLTEEQEKEIHNNLDHIKGDKFKLMTKEEHNKLGRK
jgi:hypothetical protein